MSYTKFSNLSQKFNSDMTKKIMRAIADQEYMNGKCNCNVRSKMRDGRYMYDGKFRQGMVVYELKCKITGKS